MVDEVPEVASDCLSRIGVEADAAARPFDHVPDGREVTHRNSYASEDAVEQLVGEGNCEVLLDLSCRVDPHIVATEQREDLLEQVLPLLSGYDVGVYAARQIEENFAISLPNKLFDCICAGIAVAMSDFPAIRDVVERTGCGICLNPDSTETIARDLRNLVDHPEAIDEMKTHSREVAPTYAWEAQGAKIIRAFEDLLS